MPIFEYRCESCEHQFEQLIRGAEAAECPQCGAQRAEKLLSATSVHSRASSLPISSVCAPSDAPPCNPHCCRLPQ